MYTPASLAALAFGSLTSAQVISQFSQPNRLFGTSFGQPGVNATYDYVVVGGGLAGNVVATRLIEAGVGTVAIIEAGSFASLSTGNWSQIPYYNDKYDEGTPDDWQPTIDWGLETEPQRNGKILHYAQGKVLGGGSVRNQMLYHRSTAGAYDRWAEVVGDDSYAWNNYLPFYTKSVHFTPPNTEARAPNATVRYNASDYSPEGGPLQVSYPSYAQPIGSYAEAAFSVLGIQPQDGLVSGKLNGSTYWTYTEDPNGGVRSQSESTYLASVFNSPGTVNMTVYTNAQAMNILFNGNKTATGVNVTTFGIKPYTISARKEIIISAGAYHSPQLLMVSGVGPAATLAKYNISVVQANPNVGQGMWDSHPVGSSSFHTELIAQPEWGVGARLAQAEAQFLANGTGPFTNIGTDFCAWEKLPRTNLSAAAVAHLDSFPADWPDVEYNIAGSARALQNVAGSANMAVSAISMVGYARGNMTIKSASMFDTPVIDPNWLRSDIDIEIATAIMKRARMVTAAVGARIGPEVSPGSNITTDAQISDFIMRNVGVIHHASASCRMGRNASVGVVDSKARVFGVRGLRVIDSSSLLYTPPGHTQGVTYAHAEKLVHDIIMRN